jgi:murein DD-endopeptidase MepM/ murein hydrolase activator NlpD
VAATLQEIGSLQQAVKDRAVQQFIRGSRETGAGFDEDLAASTRAGVLARFVSLEDDDALDEYKRVTEDLGVLQSQLAAARESSQSLIAQMRSRTNAALAQLEKLQKLEAERKAREQRLQQAAAARRSTQTSTGRVAVVTGGGGWMCPVQGPRAFTNDWGQPRSGGRRHQGTDILAPRGTPVVAVVGGSVRGHNSRLGGISFYLNGDDGNTYFGTHLDSLSGASGRVRQGTTLGYVGDSGNARGGPTHLHFEIHPGGGRAVNPYPTLRQYC